MEVRSAVRGEDGACRAVDAKESELQFTLGRERKEGEAFKRTGMWRCSPVSSAITSCL